MRKKVYGATMSQKCFICGEPSTAKNSQGLPSCRKHSFEYRDFKCVCGSYLEVKESKYGLFFVCVNCGPVSYNKALSFNINS